MQEQPKNPLHGITLEKIVTGLFERYGWEELGRRIDIRCFKNDPSIKSSLKFLRKTPWARDKVEKLYLDMQEPSIEKRSTEKHSIEKHSIEKDGTEEVINQHIWGKK